MKLSAKLLGSVCALAVFAVPLLVVATVRAQNVNDFTIQSFEADYYLNRNGDKHSKMTIHEEITAVFPQEDQNHGIERALPKVYAGHGVRLQVNDVQNGLSQKLPYTTYERNSNLVLRIGDPYNYVHGAQVYRINYTLQDVIKEFDDHDELFWDVNGTEWRQSFGNVVARLHVGQDLAPTFNNRLRCVEGHAGAQGKECEIDATKTDEGNLLITARTTATLSPYENLSFVAGFKPDTFIGYQKAGLERLFPTVFLIWMTISTAILLVMIAVLVRAWHRYGRAPAGKGSIVPEYLPPKDLSVIHAATVLKKTERAVTAQIIDLAVRHYCRIYEVTSKTWYGSTKRNYEIELVRPVSELRPDEEAVARMLFGEPPVLRKRVAFKDLSNKLYRQAAKLQKDSKAKTVAQGYFEDRTKERRRYYWIGGIMTGLGLITLSPGAFIAGIATLIVAGNFWQLTTKGVTARDYLLGLKYYMQSAEKDRLKALQSPQGAAKAINTGDQGQLVKLYERILPYAVLFGIEEEWAKQFAHLYQEPPEWYSGNWHTFNAAVFASSIHHFNTVSSAAFASPSDSSSSGLSGGSSGGGGGGGGGGGW